MAVFTPDDGPSSEPPGGGVPGPIAGIAGSPQAAAQPPAPHDRRANALKTGLTASTLLARHVGERGFAELHAELVACYQPADPVAAALVRQLATRLAACRLGEHALRGTLETGVDYAQQQEQLRASFGRPGRSAEAILATAVTAPATERVTKYMTSHERAILRLVGAIEALGERSFARGSAPDPVATEPLRWLPADTEDDCLRIFLAWREQAAIPCPACGSRSPPVVIGSEPRLRCPACRHRTGLRYGTILARSPIPLQAWFSLIRQIADVPHSTVADLQDATGMTRKKTLRQLAQFVRGTLASPQDAGPLLAMCGLILPATSATSTPSQLPHRIPRYA